MTSSSTVFDVAVFLMSGFVTGPSFIAISLLGMELWQFSFITDWPKIWKSEIILSEFCPIFEDRVELGIQNFGWMFLRTSYWTLQNCRVTAFTVSELIRENQQGSKTQLKYNSWVPSFFPYSWRRNCVIICEIEFNTFMYDHYKRQFFVTTMKDNLKP